MAENHFIATHTDLENKLAELDQLLADCARQRKPITQPTFESIALGTRFHAEKAVPIIAAADPQYFGIVEVLFLGLCGWVVSPDDHTIPLIFMNHAILDHVASAEEQAGLRGDFHFSRDFIARYLMVGRDFLGDVYYAMSGHYGFSLAPERNTLGEWLSGEKRALNTLVKACQLVHFAADHLADVKEYRRTSLTLIIETLGAMRDDELVERTAFYEAWGTNKSTLALLYAASTITRDGSNLLDRILSGELRATEFLSSFELWMGRARYFAERILPTLRISELAKDNMKPLKNHTGTAFNHAPFSAPEIDFISRKFKKNQTLRSKQVRR